MMMMMMQGKGKK